MIEMLDTAKVGPDPIYHPPEDNEKPWTQHIIKET